MDKQITTAQGMVTIRPAIPAEAALVRDIRLEGLKNHPEAFGADYESSMAESVQFWADRITKHTLKNEGVICIASAETSFVGMAGIYSSSNPKMRHNGTLWGVYLKADWRGLGIAESLIMQCLDWAKDQHLMAVKLAVITCNTAAIRCYSRCGFNIYGVDPKVIRFNDIYYDELLMVKPI